MIMCDMRHDASPSHGIEGSMRCVEDVQRRFPHAVPHGSASDSLQRGAAVWQIYARRMAKYPDQTGKNSLPLASAAGKHDAFTSDSAGRP
jgi:hypothetical protein